mmetsp:Transcript_94327/g.210946  ORF Transcript_94327/g.210946 Transcript_94327/m.210946 type:complete len:588 (+) Transcript_94327:84-1847(+)
MSESTGKLSEGLSEQLTTLAAGASKWHEMADADRASVARACRAQLATLDMDWVPDNMRCIGLEPSQRDAYNTVGFDPFLFMATVAERLDKLAECYEGSLKVAEGTSIAFDRQLPEQGPSIYKVGAVGQSAPGVNLEVWADPSGEDAEPSSALAPGVGVVLGAGNQNFLTVVDVLELAFIHKKCVLLKHHPLRHFMMAPFQHIFAPLAAKGAYAQCREVDVAGAHSALVSHPLVTHVHMTGSGATHDRVQAALVAAGRDKDVLFTSELGCVTPWIVCPGTSNQGQWQQPEIEHHATMLAAAFKSSCSMNCLSPKVLVLPSEEVWPQRLQFLEALKEKLASMPQPPPYYPGAHQRFAGFEKEYPDAQRIDAPPSQEVGRCLTAAVYESLGQDIKLLPSLLVDVGTIGDAASRPYALQTEAFSPVLAIATVACEGAKDFPLAASRAVNEHVFGTLSCNLIYPDERDEALDSVLQALNYGCISVNSWAAFNYGNSLGVWGGAPGSYKTSAPASGLGFVGNLARIPRVRKAVSTSAFLNKGITMSKAMPYIVADALMVLIAGKRFAGMRIMGILLRRLFGVIPPALPGGRCV